jgi:hypothetical protein
MSDVGGKQIKFDQAVLKRFLAQAIYNESGGMIDMEVTGFMAFLGNGAAMSFDHLAVNLKPKAAPKKIAIGKLSLASVDGIQAA